MENNKQKCTVKKSVQVLASYMVYYLSHGIEVFDSIKDTHDNNQVPEL